MILSLLLLQLLLAFLKVKWRLDGKGRCAAPCDPALHAPQDDAAKRQQPPHRELPGVLERLVIGGLRWCVRCDGGGGGGRLAGRCEKAQTMIFMSVPYPCKGGCCCCCYCSACPANSCRGTHRGCAACFANDVGSGRWLLLLLLQALLLRLPGHGCHIWPADGEQRVVGAGCGALSWHICIGSTATEARRLRRQAVRPLQQRRRLARASLTWARPIAVRPLYPHAWAMATAEQAASAALRACPRCWRASLQSQLEHVRS